MSNLPAEEKPAEGSKIASLAAMVKGFLPKISLDDFPVEPEKACEKLPLFLPCWLKRFGKISKPEARQAFSIAAPKLGTAERDSFINNLSSYRKFLMKKRANQVWGKNRCACACCFEAAGKHGARCPQQEVAHQNSWEGGAQKWGKIFQHWGPWACESWQAGKAAASNPKVIIAAETESSWSAAQSLLAFFSPEIAHFFQRLQVAKTEKATVVFTAHFFPEIAGSKDWEGYCSIYCPFFSRDCR